MQQFELVMFEKIDNVNNNITEVKTNIKDLNDKFKEHSEKINDLSKFKTHIESFYKYSIILIGGIFAIIKLFS